MATRQPGADGPLLFIDLNAAAGQDLPAQHTAIPALQNLIRRTVKKLGLHELLRFYFNDPVKSGLAGIAQELERLPAFGELTAKSLFLHEPENRTLLGERLDSGLPALLFMDPFSDGYAQEMLLKACNTWRPDLLLFLNPDSLQKAVTGKKWASPWQNCLESGCRLSALSVEKRK